MAKGVCCAILRSGAQDWHNELEAGTGLQAGEAETGGLLGLEDFQPKRTNSGPGFEERRCL